MVLSHAVCRPPARPAVPHMGNHLAGAALVSFTCHSAPRKNSTCNIMSGLNIGALQMPCMTGVEPRHLARSIFQNQSCSSVSHNQTLSVRGRERETERGLTLVCGAFTSPGELTFLAPSNLFGVHISSSHPLQHSNVSAASPGRALHSHIQAQRRVALSVCLSARLR